MCIDGGGETRAAAVYFFLFSSFLFPFCIVYNRDSRSGQHLPAMELFLLVY